MTTETSFTANGLFFTVTDAQQAALEYASTYEEVYTEHDEDDYHRAQQRLNRQA